VEPTTSMQPPTAHLPKGAPTPTLEDPTAGGHLCGALRREGQIRQDRERGIAEPWPYCGSRAGRGTDHSGIGRCKDHAGNSPSGRRSAQIQLAALVPVAIQVSARLLVSETTPDSVKAQVARDILDRTGHPRRLDLDVDAAREGLVDRIWSLQQTDEAEN
jgi:hypothetical protein